MNWYWNVSFTEMFVISLLISLPIAIALFVVCLWFAQGVVGMIKEITEKEQA